MAKHMLTTEDNPFNPVTNYAAWFAYDAQLGYHTPSYLARVTVTSEELSEADQAVAVEDAIDEIISEHAGKFYKKVPIPG